jgi:hypothetical protein
LYSISIEEKPICHQKMHTCMHERTINKVVWAGLTLNKHKQTNKPSTSSSASHHMFALNTTYTSSSYMTYMQSKASSHTLEKASMYSFIHLFNYASMHACMHSIMQSSIHSLVIHSFTHSSIHSLTHPFIHSLIHSFTHSSIHSLRVLEKTKQPSAPAGMVHSKPNLAAVAKTSSIFTFRRA